MNPTTRDAHIVYKNEDRPIFGFPRRHSGETLVAIAQRFFPKELALLSEGDAGVNDDREEEYAIMILTLSLPERLVIEGTWMAGEEKASWVLGVELPKEPTEADRKDAREYLDACREGLEMIFEPHGGIGEAMEFMPIRHTVLELKGELKMQASSAELEGAHLPQNGGGNVLGGWTLGALSAEGSEGAILPPETTALATA